MESEDARALTNGEAAPNVSLVDALNLLLRRWRLIVGVPAILVLVTAVYNMSKPRTYTARTLLAAEGTDQNSRGLSGLAAQFGISMGGTQSAESPEFYANLITSREILERVAGSEFTTTVDGGTIKRPLTQILKIRDVNERRRLAEGVRALSKRINVSTGRETGIISVAVTLPDAQVAAQIASMLVSLVSQFDLERRQTRAGAERRFVEARLAEESKALRQAEDALQRFLLNNRQFDSPALSFTRDRLERQVATRQQLVTSIREAYEQARIEEVRNIPAITVVERPAPPVFPNPRGTISKSLVVGVMGVMLGILLALAREAVQRSLAKGDEGATEFAARLRPFAQPGRLRRIIRIRTAGAGNGSPATEEIVTPGDPDA